VDQRYGHVEDVVIGFDEKPFQFIRWKNPVTSDERDSIVRRYVHVEDDNASTTFDIEYPLIEARSFSMRKLSKGLDAGSQQPGLPRRNSLWSR
jgi:hypothetical protein